MKILVVERHKALRVIIRQALSQIEGYRIEATDSAASAWSMIEENSFDLVICAVFLTDGFTGFDLLKQCRGDERFGGLPFMLTVEDSTEHVLAKAIELDVDDVLIKPFSVDTLVNRVRDLVSMVNSAEATLYRQLKAISGEDKINEALSILDFIEELVQLKLAKWIHTKGKLKYKLGQRAEALELFKQAIDSCKLYVPAYDECANILFELGEMDDAIQYMEHADMLGCPSEARMMKLGEAYLELDDMDNSKRIFSKLLNGYEGESGQIIDQIANLYAKHDHTDNVEELYYSVINKSNNIDSFNRIGIYFREKGNYRESESCYLRALKLCPDSPVVYYNLGILHHVTQNNTKAKYYMNKALALDPTFKPALEAFASL